MPYKLDGVDFRQQREVSDEILPIRLAILVAQHIAAKSSKIIKNKLVERIMSIAGSPKSHSQHLI